MLRQATSSQPMALWMRWLIALAISSFILLDVYLVEVVVGRAFPNRFKDSTQLRTVLRGFSTTTRRVAPGTIIETVNIQQDQLIANAKHDMEHSHAAGASRLGSSTSQPAVKSQVSQVSQEQPATQQKADTSVQTNSLRKDSTVRSKLAAQSSDSQPGRGSSKVDAAPAASQQPQPTAAEALSRRQIQVPTGLKFLSPDTATFFKGLNKPDELDRTNWKGMRPHNLPEDFDWKAYLDYNPDLRTFGVDSPQMAAAHYLGWGHKEVRVYKRLHVVLRYTSCGGLMNQHYSHVAAMTLATALGTDVLLPHAVKRDSFGNYFHQDPTRNRVQWSSSSFNTLWDSEYITAVWKSQGVDIELAPFNVTSVPNFALPATAYQMYNLDGFKPEQFIRIEQFYLASKDFPVLLEEIRKKIVERSAILQTQVDAVHRSYPPLVLDLPCTLFCMKMVDQPLASHVARQFRFSPAIQFLADRVVDKLALAGHPTYNALHLRVEQDAVDWALMLGGRANLWNLYTSRCQAAGFNNETVLYIATGLLSYQDQTQMHEVRQRLKPYAKMLAYKELFLSDDDLKDLHPEQLALIDFLVIARAHHFVGISVSTFSVFIREYRYLHNISPRSTSFLVDGSVVGTEPLFARSAVFQ